MASAPSEPRPVLGRLDRSGRLIAADPELENLQREAGSDLGQTLALPQVAAVAQLARKLGTSVGRPAIAASAENDIELWVNAKPEGDEIALSLEGWTVRPAAGPRLATILAGGGEAAGAAAQNEWTTDEELRIISLSSEFANLLGVEVAEAAGAPLTRILRLEEDADGEMPLISALAARRGFSGQRARSRSDENCMVVLNGDVVTAADGNFAGFRGTAESEKPSAGPGAARPIGFDHGLDELLRSPIDRIIESAEQIVARSDGPLRGDYASYGNDIASAARHLLSVLRAMSEDPTHVHGLVDLASLAAEAVIMLESSAEERAVHIELDRPEPLRARGQERAVIQILVNLIVNAIRYSPESGTVRLSFSRTAGTASVTVSDEGPGIGAGDEQRIFERFERAHSKEGGTGLGLAISRRLARSMGGDVTLDSAPGEGARFTLTLPAA
ncbi:sensor histidine kinase [Sphingomonas segetis]|uniref:sensor histidine kinase n=1 Tax=Sphingomonas segetis TaxID=1104779 RepID=UPI0012D34B65|nr:HAMP domain-containing sensor histidine kinase [Sphingomonas segetis]